MTIYLYRFAESAGVRVELNEKETAFALILPNPENDRTIATEWISKNEENVHTTFPIGKSPYFMIEKKLTDGSTRSKKFMVDPRDTGGKIEIEILNF